jgi:hypothetical protein
MINVRLTYDNLTGGTNTFNEAFDNAELALFYLAGYIDAFPMNITSMEVAHV